MGREVASNKNLLFLPGDGIGPEITDVTKKILELVSKKFNYELKLKMAGADHIISDINDIINFF